MSAGKRPSLAESMRQAVQLQEPPPPEPTPAPLSAPDPVVGKLAQRTAEPATRPVATQGRGSSFYAATRAGKKKVTANLDPATHKQLKSLALDLDTTTEALLDEAIRDLFAKHGKSVH